MDVSRRSILAMAAAAPLVSGAADDEAYWAGIAAHYDVTREVLQFEHGNWGMMARPVLAAYQEQVARVNRDTSFYARRAMIGDLAKVRETLAAAMGVTVDEVVLTRNASEALIAAITGYNKLQQGHGVLVADLDYDSMILACESLARTRRARIVRVPLPEPASQQGLIDAYAQAFDANPHLRLVLLTHVSHRTGLALPVREIAAQARMRGLDVIVDAAHSFGQLDFRVPDLGADFVGINLHKWIGNPLGVGALYVRRSRVGDLDPHPGELDRPNDITSRVHTGTPDYAAQLTLPTALDFQAGIGAARRAARLCALSNRWTRRLRGLEGLQILTPDDDRLHGAITSFRLVGRTSVDDNRAVVARLLDEHRVFTVHRAGPVRGACVRVTPALATTMTDIDRFAAALQAVVTS